MSNEYKLGEEMLLLHNTHLVRSMEMIVTWTIVSIDDSGQYSEAHVLAMQTHMGGAQSCHLG